MNKHEKQIKVKEGETMKRLTVVLSVVCICCFFFAACGNTNSTDDSKPKETESPSIQQQEPTEEKKSDSKVEAIDFTTESGRIKYIGHEKANEGLVDNDKALVVSFEFTNNQEDSAQPWTAFEVKFFQNGVQLDSNYSYSSEGGEQYELVGAKFKEVLNGGTLKFAEIALLEDDSPLTIKVVRNDGKGDEYQQMEIDLENGKKVASEEKEEVTADVIDTALQGTWSIAGGSFNFHNGNVDLLSQGQTVPGTYEINTSESVINGTFQANDGNLSITLPYSYSDGVLTILNNEGEVLTKEQ